MASGRGSLVLPGQGKEAADSQFPGNYDYSGHGPAASGDHFTCSIGPHVISIMTSAQF